jgi:Putative zinc-finger
MLKCKDVGENASSYVDNTLTWREKLSWYMHLAICHHCRRFIRQLRMTITFSHALKVEELSANDAKVIVDTVVKHEHQRE